MNNKTTTKSRGDKMNTEIVMKEGMIQIVCMVCKKHIGEKDGEGQTGLSHSYCEECAAEALESI